MNIYKKVYIKIFIILLCINNLSAGDKKKADRLIQYVELNKSQLSLDSIAFYYNEIGITLDIEGLYYLEKALEISQNVNNLKIQAKVLEDLSSIHRILGNKVAAIDYLLMAIEINKAFEDKYLEAINYSQLASIYCSDKDYLEGIKYHELSLEAFSQSSEKDIYNYMMINLNAGENYRLLKKYDKAINLFTSVLTLNDDTKKDETIYGYAYGNLGMTQMSIHQYKEAEKNLKLGFHYLKRVGDHISAEIYRVELGKLHLQKKNEKRAESIFLNAYNNFKSLQAKEQIRDISNELVTFYEERNQLDKALFYEREKALYNDSLINKETIKKLEQGKHQIEMNIIQHELEVMEEKARFRSILNMIGVFFSLMLMVVIFFLFKLSVKTRNKSNMIANQRDLLLVREDEKAILLKELNHRVKNNLQMISSLLNLQSRQLGDHPDAVKAIDSGRFRVEAMSLIHQKLYQKDVHTEIDIQPYIEELVLNLTYSFQASFKPIFKIEDIDIHIDKAIPMGLIINEFVTNAMKYAFEDIENPQLIIELKRYEHQIVLKVKDNGVGIHRSKSTGTSFGLELVNSLVKQLGGTLTYETGRGTTCILIINEHEQTN